MKTRTMKKALSLFLAVLMIALAIPFTVLTAVAEDVTTIKSVMLLAKKSNSGDDIGTHPGDGTWGPVKFAFDGKVGTEAQSKGTKDCFPTHYLDSNNEFQCNYTEEGVGVYYGLWKIQLSALSNVEDFTIWSPESYLHTRYFANDAYDIYYSTDDISYTKVNEETFTDICPKVDNGTGANALEYFTLGEYNGQKGYKHVIDMNGVAAKYIVIAVVTPTYSKTNDMILSEVSVNATPVPPTAPAEYTLYENANDGDLLYAVDFSATDYGFLFADDNNNWNRVKPIVFDNGRAVTVDYTNVSTTGKDQGRAKYYTQFSEYTVGGKAYTVEFTIDSTVPVGILLDCGSGFVINPSTNTTSIGEYTNYKAVGADEVYDGTGASKQTYAIELKCASEIKKNKGGCDAYFPSVYKLYVKNETNNTWELIREVPADKAYMFEWETGGWDNLFFSVARYGDSGTTSTVSNVNIYKGINVLDEISASSSIYLQKSLDGTAIRFVGVVNLTEEELNDFYKLGFNVTMTYDGYAYTNTYTTTTVFTSLIANGKTVYASEYGGTYFYAIEITGLGAAESEVVFDVDGIMIRAGETDAEVFGSITATFAPEA